MVKFIANNNKLIFIKLSLFFPIKSLYPCMSFATLELFNASIYKRIIKQKALDIFENI